MEVQQKVVRVLYCILFAFLAISLRVSTLTTLQREERMRDAKRPKERSLLLRADRGPIFDRFGIPLAVNKICYQAAIYYSQILEIPSISWQKNAKGKKERVFSRKNYITALSEKLAPFLEMDPLRIEDLIHSKASLFPHVPFILKTHSSEKTHYRLKALEKDWPGLQAEIASTRYYPLGKTGCHLIGTVGAISAKEYSDLAKEMKELKKALDLYEKGLEISPVKPFASFEEMYLRYNKLKEKSYSMNDLVGKSGVEAQFEEKLRGYFGKKNFEVDQKGRFVKETFGAKAPISGEEIVLTISSELQMFAEHLLIESEKTREGRSIKKAEPEKAAKIQKQPWIKGGAIVAIDPKNGEILAMASYPRFDPNDFTQVGNPRVHQWLEDRLYIGALWDGKERLEKEGIGSLLTWNLFLDFILPREGNFRAFFQKLHSVKKGIELQEDFEAALYFSKMEPLLFLEKLQKEPSFFSKNREISPYIARISAQLSSIEEPKDQLFMIDLCRATLNAPRFSDGLLAKMGSMSLSRYRELSQTFLRFEETWKEREKEAFKKEFSSWRKIHQKEFLAAQREEEKRKKRYPKPYLDYLDKKEKELFEAFWKEHKYPILQRAILEEKGEGDVVSLQKTLASFPQELQIDFLRTIEPFSENERPLYGALSGATCGKELIERFYPKEKLGYLRSYAYQATSPLGSLFKVVTAYEGLRQGISSFVILDEFRNVKGKQIVARSLTGTPYPRIYKGGRLPKSSASSVGKIDLLGALERSSNPFFSILAGDFFNEPNDLKRAALTFGLGQKTGIDLPFEVRGNLPSDLMENRAGLYSFAIGQHTLLSTPLQAATFLSTVANGGTLWKPKITLRTKGEMPKESALEVFSFEKTYMKEELESVGIHFPLFTSLSLPSSSQKRHASRQEKVRNVFLPYSIQKELFEGMDRSLWSEKGSARPIAIRAFLGKAELLKEYLSLKHQMIGKTSTSQVLYNPNLNPSSKAEIYKDLWFGGIAFPEALAFEKDPEIVVIVLLRFGDSGKEAAPLAARMVTKWREIQKKYHGL